MSRHGKAQAGQGDPRVVAHPGYRRIPPCEFPLATEKAQTKYDDLARMLFEAGRMTVERHLQLSSYAMQFDAVTKRALDGQPVRPAAFIQLDKALKALRLDEIDKTVAAPQSASTNPFARNGFSSRSR